MSKNKVFKRKLLATFLFSLASAALLIIHGLFFDLDISQIQRLTLEGFIATFVLVFVGLLILERIFDIEDHEEIIKMKKRIARLERKNE